MRQRRNHFAPRVLPIVSFARRIVPLVLRRMAPHREAMAPGGVAAVLRLAMAPGGVAAVLRLATAPGGVAAVLRLALVAVGALGACDAQIPDVSPTDFACVDDRRLSDGTLPCPETHACFEQQCTPRWQCNDRTDDQPGCRPDTTRCEPVFNALTSAVQCVSGVHTSTTVIPSPAVDCACPDGLFCVVAAGDDLSAYPLYLLPTGGALPDQLGLPTEAPSSRRCVRVCSGEVDCSPDHSCRPAAVVQDAASGEGLERHTIGVCYPNTLVDTSTAIRPVQLDPDVCRQNADCAEDGVGRACRAGVLSVPDHPLFPAGDARDPVASTAIVTRCEFARAGLAQAGAGCTDSANCASGVCVDGRCRTVCDPQDPITACQNDTCGPRRIERGDVSDEIFLCR